MDKRKLDHLNNVMCALPKDLFNLTHRAVMTWYNFGNRSLLNDVAERIGISPEDVLLWWDS